MNEDTTLTSRRSPGGPGSFLHFHLKPSRRSFVVLACIVVLLKVMSLFVLGEIPTKATQPLHYADFYWMWLGETILLIGIAWLLGYFVEISGQARRSSATQIEAVVASLRDGKFSKAFVNRGDELESMTAGINDLADCLLAHGLVTRPQSEGMPDLAQGSILEVHRRRDKISNRLRGIVKRMSIYRLKKTQVGPNKR